MCCLREFFKQIQIIYFRSWTFTIYSNTAMKNLNHKYLWLFWIVIDLSTAHDIICYTTHICLIRTILDAVYINNNIFLIKKYIKFVITSIVVNKSFQFLDSRWLLNKYLEGPDTYVVVFLSSRVFTVHSNKSHSDQISNQYVDAI